MPKKTISRSKKQISRPKRSSPKPAKTIGILHSGTKGKHDKMIAEFKKYLKQAGYSEPTNLTIAPNGIPLWSDDDPQKLTNNAKTLATTAGVDLIIAAGGSASVYAAQGATSTNGRPVVFTSFSQRISPANNMTGVCARTSELDVDRLTHLYNLVQPQPQTTFGVLENQKRSDYDKSKLDDEARRLNLRLDRISVFKQPGEIDQDVITRINNAFTKWKQNGLKTALVAADPIFNDHRKELISAAKSSGIATMHQWHEFVDEGAYASYGTSIKEAYQKAGIIAGRVLDGEAPSAIPVYVLGNIALPINRATAKRLRLTPKA
jgi:putative tryptophan/tyrosine transport system substrate-binding protein